MISSEKEKKRKKRENQSDSNSENGDGGRWQWRRRQFSQKISLNSCVRTSSAKKMANERNNKWKANENNERDSERERDRDAEHEHIARGTEKMNSNILHKMKIKLKWLITKVEACNTVWYASKNVRSFSLSFALIYSNRLKSGGKK